MKFEDWFYEPEGFALRAERFYDEMDMFFGKELSQQNMIKVVSWLRAAYEEGYNQSRYDTMKLYWDDGK